MVLAKGVLRGTHALSLWPHPHFFLLWRGTSSSRSCPIFSPSDESRVTTRAVPSSALATKSSTLPFPLLEIGLDLRWPGAIDLAGGVFALADPLVAELVAQANQFRPLDDFLGEVGRDEDHSLAGAQHDVAR